MYIGIDIGGTNIKIVLIDPDGNILQFKKIRTNNNLQDIEQDISETIDQLAFFANISKQEIKAIGIGSAGVIDRKSGIIFTSPNILVMKKYPIVKRIEKVTGIKTFLENDATSAAIGESWKGNGRKFNNWIMVTLGTGIGGGIIINNELYSGSNGSAMEIGHTSIDYNGKCEVLDLKDGIMVMMRVEFSDGVEDGAYLWREFTKDN